MSLTKEALFPSVPFVERATRVNFGAHPKGRYILYGNKKNVIICDIINHSDNDVYFNHPTDVRCAKYSPTGFYVASGDKSGRVQIWDTTQKEHLMKNEFSLLSEIKDLAWSSDSARIAVGGRGSEKFGKVINAELGTEVGEVVGMSRPINAVDFKPTRPFRLATGSEDFLVCFFEGPPFKFKKSISKHKNFVNCCKFSPKGDIYVTGGADGRIYAFNANDTEFVGEFGSPAHSSGIYGLEFSSSGSRLVSVSTDKTVKLWDSGSGNFNLLSEFAFENKPENQQLGCVWVGDKLVTVSLSGAMQVFNAGPDVKELAAPADVIYGHSRPIKCSAYSKSANRLVTASTDMVMLSWDLTKGVAEPFNGPEAHTSSIEAMTICGDKVISVGVDDRLVVSSLTKRSFDLSVKLESQPRALASADNQLVVVACYQHVCLFSVADANAAPKRLVCSKEDGEPTTCTISKFGDLAVVGKSDGTLLFYSTKDGKSLSPIPHVSEKMKGTATTMGFSPNGKYLAVGDSERHLRLYQVNSSSGGDNSPLVTLVHEWRSHAARVTCMAWNPNSTLLASGSLDCSIMIFKPDSDTRLVDCRNAHPANMITSLVWTSDDTLYSTGQDAFVQGWRFK